MILQRLVEYYDRLAADPATADAMAKPGYSLQKISFCVVLEPDGTLQQFQSLLYTEGKRQLPEMHLVPGQSKPPGSGIKPCFLWDNAAYMLGYKADDPNPQRTRESFEAFRDRHLAVEPEINSPAFSAVCNFLRNWSSDRAAEYEDVLKEITSNYFGVFRIAGERRLVHDDPAIVEYWSRQTSDDNSPRGICLVTGVDSPIARLHEPKIKGVRGGQSSGALLVSFNDSAYESYGKSQSYNAPVSESAAFKYANALNYLLNRDDRRISLGDATVVFWADRPSELEEYASDLFTDAILPPEDAPAEDKQRAQQVRLFLSQLRAGHAGDEAIQADRETRFFILALSPNAARISVRFWIDSNVAEMKQRLAQHMQDIELVGAREADPPLMIRRIVNATGRAEFDSNGRFKGYDTDAVSPLLAGAVARAVFTGGPYPQALLAALVGRLRADSAIRHERIAPIKACLVRNSRLKGQPKEVPVALNVHHPSPAYHCGRLLCLLDYIQGQAIRNVNAGLVKKYYTIASVQPFAIFGRLIALTTKAHLPKLDGPETPGLAQFCERQLRQIISQIGDCFPRTLNLEEQGEFALGFYQQKEELPDTPPKYQVKTIRGELVRSKSEALIANALHARGIDYEYEPLLSSGDQVLRPDFVIQGETPLDNIFIEHLGLMDNPKYVARWEKKLAAYRAIGILPEAEGGGSDGTLVTFAETKDSVIDTNIIDQKLAQLFPRTNSQEGDPQ